MALAAANLQNRPLLLREEEAAPLWNGHEIVVVDYFSDNYHLWTPINKIMDISNIPLRLLSLFGFAIYSTFRFYIESTLTLPLTILVTALLLLNIICDMRPLLKTILSWSALHLGPGFFYNAPLLQGLIIKLLNSNLTINGSDPSLFKLSQKKQMALEERQHFVSPKLSPYLPRKDILDPAIRQEHFMEQLPANEIPEPPAHLNLDQLSNFHQDIDLSKYVAHVKNGCEGLQGAFKTGSREANEFKSRLDRLSRHILYQLQHGSHEEWIKKEVCEALESASRLCAPRHLEESERQYHNLTGQLEPLNIKQKALQIVQKLQMEVVERMTCDASGSTHARKGILNILGPIFHIPGHNRHRDRFARAFDPEDVKKVFQGLYSSDAIVKRLSSAVNAPPKHREIPLAELADWFKANIPEDYVPPPAPLGMEEEPASEEERKQARQLAYLTEYVYTDHGVKPEALRYALISMGILKN